MKSLGVDLEDISSREADYYELTGGVRITNVRNGKIAAQTRIREGFIITAIDDKKVKDGNDLARMLKDREGESVILEGFYPTYPNKIYNYGLSL